MLDKAKEHIVYWEAVARDGPVDHRAVGRRTSCPRVFSLGPSHAHAHANKTCGAWKPLIYLLRGDNVTRFGNAVLEAVRWPCTNQK